MNLKSEQLLANNTIIMDYDQPIRGKNVILKALQNSLGYENVHVKKLDDKNVYVYTNSNGNKIILLCAAITYMGGDGKNTLHPAYLKRIQIPPWWKQIVTNHSSDYDIRFIGIYRYNEIQIFTDIIKDTFILRDLNNSSAHIYFNDLFKGHTSGLFKRTDQNNNSFITLSNTNFKNYLENNYTEYNQFKYFKEFNSIFFHNQWITASEAINEMKDSNSLHWRETEWPGWNLEFQFEKYVISNSTNMNFTADTNKGENSLDFDLWFTDDLFYGDLKSSADHTREIPGNDYTNVMNALKEFGKLWYIIYEHETKRDKDHYYEETEKRAFLIREDGSWPKNKPFNARSYGTKMKNAVKYTNMYIIELTEMNIHHYANIFNQGKQPSGHARKPKIKLSKGQIQNAIIYSENAN